MTRLLLVPIVFVILVVMLLGEGRAQTPARLNCAPVFPSGAVAEAFDQISDTVERLTNNRTASVTFRPYRSDDGRWALFIFSSDGMSCMLGAGQTSTTVDLNAARPIDPHRPADPQAFERGADTTRGRGRKTAI